MRLSLFFFASVLAAQTPCPSTPAYSRCELVFELTREESAAHSNPYQSVQLHGEFRSPKHRTFLMPAFWDGGNRFVIRFAPTDPGTWDYRISSNIRRFDGQTGSFTAADSDSPGFIRPRNVHHWSHTEFDRPHLWMGDTNYDLAALPNAEAAKYIEARAFEKFTHIRLHALGEQPGMPDIAWFRSLDDRVYQISGKGMVADLVLGRSIDQLAKRFPARSDRERFLRYMIGRYSAFNITWQLVDKFEDSARPREIAKELGTALKTLDPYNHPRSTGAVTTSAPLLPDGWMDHVSYGSLDDQLGSIEHQLYPVPFVNAALSGEGPDDFRHRLWNATMNGQYPSTLLFGSDAKPMTIWYDFFTTTRFWELEPYFDLDGGRAVALPGVEYIVYVEKPSGPVEVRVEKHTYQVRWLNPITGELSKPEDMKSERIVVEPPNRTQDWVLHLSRDGRKEGMARSYKFESRANLMQEVETTGKAIPFKVAQPSADEFSVSARPPYEASLIRQTRGTRRMMYLWTGEVSIDSQGYRMIGTGSEGTFRIQKNLAAQFPAIMNVRVYGMNANGKVYAVDKLYRLTN